MQTTLEESLKSNENMTKFEKIVVALLLVAVAELGVVCVVAVRFVNGVEVEVVEGE